MFTGLVEDVGRIASASPSGGGLRLEVDTHLPTLEIRPGDSIALDGACLTVNAPPDGARIAFTAGPETLERTTIGSWRPGRRVHLERALRLQDRLGGHLVQGHVDAVTALRRVAREIESLVWWVDLPSDLARYVAVKGSVALDGVSLTVNEIREGAFRVNLIPHTIGHTRFDDLAPGDRLNLEVDVLARYVEGLLHPGPDAGGGLTLERLSENRYL
ncbi:MAG: riboflavin synthase [Deltaproteobacteria bacterium]|nr:riboflavin synthase [Deltaproteobacteria bacterium]